MNEPICVPCQSADLQVRLMIIPHNSIAGHRRSSGTQLVLAMNFTCLTLRGDVEIFVRRGVHCVSSIKDNHTPCFFGSALHGAKPKDIVQFDHIRVEM